MSNSQAQTRDFLSEFLKQTGIVKKKCDFNKMEDRPENKIKQLCCTCLSKDRKLFQLSKVPDGVNNLYLLLSYDSEAFKEGFSKDTASLHICWECRAVMYKFTRFREQACTAQRHLTSIADGKKQSEAPCLSRLTTHHTKLYKTISESPSPTTENFIDCGPVTNIKIEVEEDMTLSDLHDNWTSDQKTEIIQPINKREITIEYEPDFTDQLKINKEQELNTRPEVKKEKKKTLFLTVIVDNSELKEILLRRKSAKSYVDAPFKCDSCIKGFNNQRELVVHNSSFHQAKPNHRQCDICLIYVNISMYQKHLETHYHKHICTFCAYSTYNVNDMLPHLRNSHDMKNLVNIKMEKSLLNITEVLNPSPKSLKEVKKIPLTSKRTELGYLCSECNIYFENKNQRWKHRQIHHREWFKCKTCGKKFAFKNILAKHEQLHKGPPPREECEVCHKMIRYDLVKIHARVHAERPVYTCTKCHKTYVCRASYENHMKHSMAHVLGDVQRYICDECGAKFVTKNSLRVHINFLHLKTQIYKCTTCNKSYRTARSLKRHVDFVHNKIRPPRDKICDYCGKGFTTQKILQTHIRTHTGERPLQCTHCPATFAHDAALYTHKKLKHKVKKK